MSVRNRMFAPLTLLAAILALALAACGGSSEPKPVDRADETGPPLLGPRCADGQRTIVAAPPSGMYHAAMPSLLHDDALSGDRSAARVRDFERLAERKLAWVYF